MTSTKNRDFREPPLPPVQPCPNRNTPLPLCPNLENTPLPIRPDFENPPLLYRPAVRVQFLGKTPLHPRSVQIKTSTIEKVHSGSLPMVEI